MLTEHGGRTYALEQVRFTGGTTQYQNFVVHREAELDVRDDRGEPHTFKLFGSVIEKNGGFKVFSYVVD